MNSKKTKARPQKPEELESPETDRNDVKKPATWDDAAMNFAETEPSDPAALANLREVLERIPVGDGSSASGVALVHARARLDEMIDSRPVDPAAMLKDVGRWIEAGSTGCLPVEPPKPTSSQTLPDDADAELTADFIVESREYLIAAEAALLALEADPDNNEAIGVIFRAFHTIKGTSAFLGLTWITDLGHRAEGLLSRVRNKEIQCLGGYADLALRSSDMLATLLLSVEKALRGEPMIQPSGYAALIEVLNNPEAAGVSASAGNQSSLPALVPVAADEETAANLEPVEPVGDIAQEEPQTRDDPEVLTRDEPAKPQRFQQRVTDNTPESSVRVRMDRLDRLVDMVGELVIAQSMTSQDPTVNQGNHLDLIRKVRHSGKIVRELQNLTMSMRMVPLKATFQKLSRLVRDVSQKSKKSVDLITLGEDTEIDRNMVDIVNDPLVHMIRNAVDHGIELPEVREKANKPRTGTIRLSAYHAGGNIVVELADDGQGLNREKILRKAVANGLIEADKTLSDSEVFNLIFAPGFSTADQVTEISGRGVGMDVVKRNIDSLRGRVDIASVPGKGCTFTISLPLTLAITDGMLVKVGHERYIIPTINIHLSFRPLSAALTNVLGRGEMVMLRNELMPIFRLHRLFDISDAIEDPTAALLVVVSDKNRKCALLVDELLGQQQVVAKSLGREMKVPGISGGAILGDGRVGLILDPAELASSARSATDGILVG